MAQAYQFALDPNSAQVSVLESHCGAARFVFNDMLGVVKANLDQRSAERSYGTVEQELTPAQGWSLARLRKTWNRRKNVVAPWWEANSKEAYNSGLNGLARALQNWSTSRCGERAGVAVGFPKFKTRHRGTRSVRFTTWGDSCGGGSPSCGAAPHRAGTHPSVDAQAGAAAAGRHGADLVGHGEFHWWALAVRVSSPGLGQNPARARRPITTPGGGGPQK